MWTFLPCASRFGSFAASRCPGCRSNFPVGLVRGETVGEGIGIGRITANLKDSPIDDAVHIPDTESVATVYRLLREEGLFLGSASGVNVAGALRVAKELGPGHTVVTILCDSGHKYQSRLFNREWLVSKGLESAIDIG